MPDRSQNCSSHFPPSHASFWAVRIRRATDEWRCRDQLGSCYSEGSSREQYCRAPDDGVTAFSCFFLSVFGRARWFNPVPLLEGVACAGSDGAISSCPAPLAPSRPCWGCQTVSVGPRRGSVSLLPNQLGKKKLSAPLSTASE